MVQIQPFCFFSITARQRCLCQVTYELLRQLKFQVQEIGSQRPVVGETPPELQLHHLLEILHLLQPNKDESIDT